MVLSLVFLTWQSILLIHLHRATSKRSPLYVIATWASAGQMHHSWPFPHVREFRLFHLWSYREYPKRVHEAQLPGRSPFAILRDVPFGSYTNSHFRQWSGSLLSSFHTTTLSMCLNLPQSAWRKMLFQCGWIYLEITASSLGVFMPQLPTRDKATGAFAGCGSYILMCNCRNEEGSENQGCLAYSCLLSSRSSVCAS